MLVGRRNKKLSPGISVYFIANSLWFRHGRSLRTPTYPLARGRPRERLAQPVPICAPPLGDAAPRAVLVREGRGLHRGCARQRLHPAASPVVLQGAEHGVRDVQAGQTQPHHQGAEGRYPEGGQDCQGEDRQRVGGGVVHDARRERDHGHAEALRAGEGSIAFHVLISIDLLCKIESEPIL